MSHILESLIQTDGQSWLPDAASSDSLEVRLELERMLYQQAPQSLAASAIVAVFIGVFLWQVADHTLLSYWLVAVLLVILLRALLVVAFHRASHLEADDERWGVLYTLGASLAGLVWGSLAFLGHPDWPLPYQILLVLMLVGMAAAAISTNAARLSTYTAFALPTLLPLVVLLLVQQDGAYVDLGLLVMLYTGMLFLTARNYHKTLKTLLVHQQHNTVLFDDLKHTIKQLWSEVSAREQAQKELSVLNDTLEQRVIERTQDLQAQVERRKQTELELEQSNHQMHSILDTAGEGIFGLDQQGLTTFINPAGVRMLGWSAEELIGCRHHELVHHTRVNGSPLPEDECAVGNTLRDGKSQFVEDELFWRKDGSSFPVEYISKPIINDENKVIGAVISFTDITERKQAEVKRHQTHKLEAVGQLAAGIAHEVNTPTQFVGDNTRFLKESFSDLGKLIDVYEQLIQATDHGESPQQYITEAKSVAEEIELDYIKQEVPLAIEQSLEGLGRIARIVRAMKEFSHPGNDVKTPTDLNQAIATTIDVSRNEWKYSAELETSLDPKLPQIPVFPGEFNQVILNLIVNAAHAIGEGDSRGVIHISTHISDKWAVISVSDNGAGIPEKIKSRIFDPFFTTKEVGKGSGQGLSLAWATIVDKHAGQIDVDSEEGKGTTFTIRLPIGAQTAILDSTVDR